MIVNIYHKCGYVLTEDLPDDSFFARLMRCPIDGRDSHGQGSFLIVIDWGVINSGSRKRHLFLGLQQHLPIYAVAIGIVQESTDFRKDDVCWWFITTIRWRWQTQIPRLGYITIGLTWRNRSSFGNSGSGKDRSYQGVDIGQSIHKENQLI